MLAVTDRISFGLACNIPAFPAGLSRAGRGSSEPSWSSVSRALHVPAASSHSTLSTPPASAEPHNIQGSCRAPGQCPPPCLFLPCAGSAVGRAAGDTALQGPAQHPQPGPTPPTALHRPTTPNPNTTESRPSFPQPFLPKTQAGHNAGL